MSEKSDHLTDLDAEGRELIEAIESDSYEPGASQMTPELLQRLREAARNTVAELSRASAAERRHPQDRLKGTVIIQGDVLSPALPEEDWDALG